MYYYMDEETEKILAGILENIIKRYECLESHMGCLENDIKTIRKEMKEAAILLRDKQSWRLEEVKKEVDGFIARIEKTD